MIPGTLNPITPAVQPSPVADQIEARTVVVDEPETEYAKQQRTKYEQVVGLGDDGTSNDDPNFEYSWVPIRERSMVTRMHKTGWRPDPRAEHVPGQEDFIRMRKPKALKREQYRASMLKVHEMQGDKVKEMPNKADDADADATTVVVNGYKDGQEILNKLPDVSPEEDES